MKNLIKNIFEYEDKYYLKIKEINIKNKIIYSIISFLFTLFFISAPICLIINLYLFVDYYILVSLFTCVVGFVGYNLFYLILYSIYNRKLEEPFDTKYLIIGNSLRMGIFTIIIFIILITIVKGMVI